MAMAAPKSVRGGSEIRQRWHFFMALYKLLYHGYFEFEVERYKQARTLLKEGNQTKKLLKKQT